MFARKPQLNYTRRDALKSLSAVGLGLALNPCAFAFNDTNYLERDYVLSVLFELSNLHALPIDWIKDSIKKARYNPTVARLMTPEKTPAQQKKRNWYAYCEKIINEERIQKGKRFLRSYVDILEKVEDVWGIEKEILTALIGIETIYGKSMGRFRVLDVLTTLSFDYMRRAEYFQNELGFFLYECFKHRQPVTAIKGSYAGAIGICQFMPSNISRFGIDFDKDGKIDIIHSPLDAIASVANYLHCAGWEKGLPTAWSCQVTNAVATRFRAGLIKTETTLQDAIDAGIDPLEPIDVSPETPVFLIDLPIEKNGVTQTEWRLATRNYAALLNYNRSYFYAESICELASRLTEPRAPKNAWTQLYF